MTESPTGPLANFVARAEPDGYVPLGRGPDETHVTVDGRCPAS